MPEDFIEAGKVLMILKQEQTQSAHWTYLPGSKYWQRKYGKCEVHLIQKESGKEKGRTSKTRC